MEDLNIIDKVENEVPLTEVTEETETQENEEESILFDSVNSQEDRSDFLGSDVHSTEAVTMVTVEQAPQDTSSNIASIFVLSMIFGLLVFMSLSGRWKS